jgi:hypothetical protein
LQWAAAFEEESGTFSSSKRSTVGTAYAFAFFLEKATGFFLSVLAPITKSRLNRERQRQKERMTRRDDCFVVKNAS